MPWEYDLTQKTYRDADTGAVLTDAEVRTAREEFLTARKERARALAADLAEERLTLAQWEAALRAEIKVTHVGVGLLGGGGRNAMTQRDYGALGRQLRTSYAFLREMSQQIGNGELSAAQVGARSEHYLDSGVQGYERARAARWGLPPLKRYPGDGSLPCRGRCLCALSIEETDDEWRVTWVRGGGENSCQGCIDQAAAWSPLVIPRLSEAEERGLALHEGRNGR